MRDLEEPKFITGVERLVFAAIVLGLFLLAPVMLYFYARLLIRLWNQIATLLGG